MTPISRTAGPLALLLTLVCTACDETESTPVDPFRPDEGRLVLDLTDPVQGAWFLEHARPFYRMDDARADEMVYTEWREGLGVCIALSGRLPDFEEEDLAPWFESPDNHYNVNSGADARQIPPREPTPSTRTKCDSCTGITIPYFTPRRLTVSLSAINIAPENLDQLFPDRPEVRADLGLSTPFSRGFIGLLTRVPARLDGDNVVAQVEPDSPHEIVYLRLANGDETPGPFASGNPLTTAQFAATDFEWFVLRTRAFESRTADDGTPVNIPVFEGVARTRFGDTDFGSLGVDVNTIELPFDLSTEQQLFVNGEEVVSAVTGQAFDRTLLGSYEPDNSTETLNVIYVDAGTYGCIHTIEMEL